MKRILKVAAVACLVSLAGVNGQEQPSQEVKTLKTQLYRAQVALKRLIDDVSRRRPEWKISDDDWKLADEKSLKRIQVGLEGLTRELDLNVILRQTVKDREEALRDFTKQIEVLRNQNAELMMIREQKAIAKAIEKHLPNWKQRAEELRKIYEALPAGELPVSIEVKTFDKNGDRLVDTDESKQAEKALKQLVDTSSSFGLTTFDTNKDGTLDDNELAKCNDAYRAIVLTRLLDRNDDGKVDEDEIKSTVFAEATKHNRMAAKFAGLISRQPVKKVTAPTIPPKSTYVIHSITSGNSLIIGRGNFLVPTTLYGTKIPAGSKETAEQAREYLVKLLADNSYRIDQKNASADLKRTCKALEKLSQIIIPKISFVDTRISTVFEFLKNRSRTLDPEGEGLSFVLIPGKANEPTVELDLDNTPLSEVVFAVAQLSGCKVGLDHGSVQVYLPGSKTNDTQETLLETSLYLFKKGRTANYLLVRNGFAECTVTTPQNAADTELKDAEALAKKEKLGIWK